MESLRCSEFERSLHPFLEILASSFFELVDSVFFFSLWK